METPERISTGSSRIRYSLKMLSILGQSPIRTIRALLRGKQIGTLAHDLLQERFEQSNDYVFVLKGLSLFLNPTDRDISPIISQLGMYEPEVTSTVERILQPGDVVVDVGANIGWYTLLAASIVGKTGRVISFEPEEMNFEYLKRSVDSNQLSMVILHRQAVWNKRGQVTLNLSSPSQHSIGRTGDGRSIQVEADTIDNSVLEYKKVKLLKVDAEGSERQVLEGSKEVIESGGVKNIIMEWNNDSWEGHFDLIRDLLKAYDCWQLTSVHCQYPSLSPVFLRRRLGSSDFQRLSGNILLRRSVS